jgi:putative GTP pyrophosphokinase
MEENIRKVINLYNSEETKFKLNRFKNQVEDFFRLNHNLNSKPLPYVHSIKSRVKSNQSLEDKLTRKINENKEITVDNLFHKITDLIGIRILHLYQDQFTKIHEEIIKQVDLGEWEFFEKPKAYTWDNEAVKLYKGLGIEAIVKDQYTSVHYVIRLKNNDVNPIYCEIQVRTLFEEIWGEIDHTINYPHKTRSIACSEQLVALSMMATAGRRLADSIFRSYKEFSEIPIPESVTILKKEHNVSIENEEVIAFVKKNDILSFSQYAIQDENFPLNDSSELTEVISNLKIHNWYVQNPAIDLLYEIDLNTLLENQDSKDKLFVLGRNIYQSASGRASNSIVLILSLKSFFTKYSDFVINCIYSGILFEIFFDKKGIIRESFNRDFFNEIFELQTLERLNESIKFIQDQLIPFQSRIFVMPSQDPKLVNVKIEFYEKSTVGKHINVITSILINDVEILTEDELNCSDYDIKGYIAYVAISLSNTYLIPLNQLYVINSEDMIGNHFMLSPEKYLKKTITSPEK